MAEFRLPDVGEGLTEAEIVAWHVKVGDTIAINDIIVDIETAKSVVELPSPYAGVVGALLVAEGETVEVGTPIIRVGEPEPAAAASPAAGPADLSAMDLSNPAASGGGEGESLVGRNKADRGPVRRARHGSASPATAAGEATQLQVQGAFSPGGAQSDEVAPSVEEEPVPAEPARATPVAQPAAPGAVRALAKPPVRKLARDLGVDLADVAATGPHGSVSRDDVQAAADSSAAPPPATTAAPVGTAREWREPVKGVRRAMAQAMVASAFSAPHVTEWVTVDVSATIQLLSRLRTHPRLRELRISPLLVLSRAVCLAVRRTPELNSWWDEAAQEVLFRGYVNLGIAAATPRGLVVPNVRDADSLDLPDLARALNELTDTARAGRTQPAQMTGGTFTITNVGPFGVDGGTPIINPGESAILCLGAARRQPWVVTDAAGVESLEIRDVCTLSLSFDHRHIDGEKGSRFLADVAGIMSDPATALLY